jgi:hypothetical protein
MISVMLLVLLIYVTIGTAIGVCATEYLEWWDVRRWAVVLIIAPFWPGTVIYVWLELYEEEEAARRKP